jgi:hypothetical protein
MKTVPFSSEAKWVAASIIPSRIIWVRLGPRGGFKKRPAVALSSPDSDGTFHAVVGTTTLINDPAREIELPWSQDGRCVTKLKKAAVVDTQWIEELSVGDVLQIGGIVPPSVFVTIQDAIRQTDKQDTEST